ncbi:DinB family protein [Winogradskyella echinorum]|uniref:DinB family protein n=1 Tax=Winogradskyella echinorum TaxID=538189 RepID=A0ABR6Y5C3_9FLAO|nr:DinB family protein [Winogradskyella echinorum]MBC3847922.1 DinB family protein [Winogradskyella echinorum]MBC5752270.1 DinB family protein [Winogradskyella echinorum]
MFNQTLIKLFRRDLIKLKDEIQLYKNESNLWKIEGAVTNCAGNLCLHLVGNINHFIGATLGNSGYIRQRDLEFSLKNVPKSELIKQVDDTIVVVDQTLIKLSEEDLQKEYSRNPFEDYMTTEYFLTHLAMHLAYHLGQINYHRRLLDA